MKIGIDIRHLCAKNRSGVAQYTISLIRRMAALDSKTEFLLFASGRQKTLSLIPQFTAPNISLHTATVPNRLLCAGLLAKKSTLEDYLTVKPDLLFLPNLNIVNTRLPFALTVHDLSFVHFREFLTVKSRAWHRATRPAELMGNAKTLLAVSQSTKNDIIEFYKIKPEKITVTHLGVSAEFKAKTQPSDRNFLRAHNIEFPYFLALSTVEPRKNLESVIEAYESWRKNTVDARGDSQTAHLVIAGGQGWKSAHIKRMAENSRFARNIHLLGYVDEKHKPALYRGAACAVFASRYEGFGLPAVESMAYSAYSLGFRVQ